MSAGASITIAKLLSAEQYGVYIVAITVLNYGAILARAGMDNGSVRYVNEYLARGKPGLAAAFLEWAQRGLLKISLAVALFAFAAGTLINLLFPTIDKGPVFVAAMGFVPLSLVYLYSSLLRAEKRIVQSQLPLSVFRPVFALLAAIALSLAGRGSGMAVAFGEVVGLAIMVVPLYSATRHLREARAETVGAGLYRKWRETSKGITLSAATQQLMGQADIVMVGILFGMASAGVYGLASRLAKLVALANRAADAIAAPMVAESFYDDDRDALQALVSQACVLVTGATLMMSAGLLLIPEAAFQWLGRSFETLRGVLLVLVAGQVVNAATGPVGVILLMTGHEKDQVRINGAFGVMLIIGIYVVSRFGGGILEAAILFAFAIGLSNVVKGLVVYARIGIKSVPSFRVGKPEGR